MQSDFDGEYFSCDNRSISSEGSTRGIVTSDPTYHGKEFFDCLVNCDENLNRDDIEYQLSRLPDAEFIKDTILENYPINKETFDNNVEHIHTALLYAVWCRNYEIVKALLENCHADSNAKDLQGLSALHLACLVGDNRICHLLLMHKANAKAWDTYVKVTPLHCAAISGNVECIQLLVEAGADINQKLGPQAPLLLAIEKNNVECVEALLKLGANPEVEEEIYGLNALHIAVVMFHNQCTRLLINYKVDVNSMCGSKRVTALHLAASDNNAGQYIRMELV